MCGAELEEELLVHPDASVLAQLQLELQDEGLVVSVHFGDEAIEAGDSFEQVGVESQARLTVKVVSVDDLTYAALDAELREELEALLE